MKNRLLALFLILIFGCLLSVRTEGQQRPDIAVFLLDDVAAADIAEVTTPNIDAIANSGVNFTRAYAQAWCSPTRNSLNQSVWQGAHRGDLCEGLVPETLDDGLPSLAKFLDGIGYGTYLIGKWHQGIASTESATWMLAPHMHGFDHWRAGRASSGLASQCVPRPTGMEVWDGALLPQGTHHTITQRDAFLDAFAEAQLEGVPFFGVLSFTDAHSPWTLPPAEILPSGYQVPQTPTSRDLFEAEIISLDVVIGELVAALPPTTWIIIVGDNGTPGAVCPPGVPGKHTVFERGVRVPMIFTGGGLAPATVATPVSVVDIAPSLTHAMGLSVDWAEGQSVFGPPRCWVYVTDAVKEEAVIDERWKLMVVDGVETLYDLENDPNELNPLPAVGPDADRLRTILGQVQ